MNRDALIAEAKRLAIKEREKDRNPFIFYSPHTGQKGFHASRARIRLLIGSTRAGKTEGGAIEALSHAKGFRPDGTKKGLPVPPTKGVILVQSFAKIVDPLLPKLQKYCGPGWIKHIKNGPSGTPELITFDNDSTIKIISQVQPETAADSADWDWGWADEPFEKKWWARLLRGLADRNAPFWFTMSPIRCAWIFTDLYLKADGKAISVHEINLRDNPYLSPEGVREYIERIPAEDRDAFIEGKFSHVKGRIFPEFERERHVVPPHLPPPGAPIYMVMDPHDRRPSYLLWCYVDDRERLVAFEEWPKEPFEEMDRCRLSVNDYATIIRNIEGKWGKQVVERIIDPRFGQTPSQGTGRTLIEDYEEYGISFCPDMPYEEVMPGHQRIHALLGSKEVEPGLLVCEDLRNLIWALDVYTWKIEDMEERNSRERPDETGKDQIDALRYLTAYGPSRDAGGGNEPPGFTPDDYGAGYG